MVKFLSNKSSYGYSITVVAAILWGTLGVWTKFMQDYGYSELSIALCAAFSISFFFLIKISVTGKYKFKVSNKMLVFLGFHGIAIANGIRFCIVNAYNYLPMSVVSILMFCSCFPILIMSRVIFKSKVTLLKIISLFIALIGVSLVLKIFDVGNSSYSFIGILWGLGGIVCIASGTILNKFYMKNGLEPETVLFYINLFGFAFLCFFITPFDFIKITIQAISYNGYIVITMILGYAFIPQIASSYLVMIGLKYIDPTYYSICFTFDPITATVFGYLVFGEKLNMIQVIGILVVLIVVIYVERRDKCDEILLNPEMTASTKF